MLSSKEREFTIRELDMIGGTTGIGGLRASFGGAAAARVGVMKAERCRAERSLEFIPPGEDRDRLQRRLNDALSSTKAMLARESASSLSFL